MTELLSAAQMRAIEQAAIEGGEVTGLELMERAGQGVVEAIFQQWPKLALEAHRAIVLCGPGNNGGDGLVVARLLKEQAWEVDVFIYGNAENLPPDAKTNYEKWQSLRDAQPWDDAAIEDRLDESAHDIVVDALFGTGLTRGMPEDTARIWHAFMPRVFSQAAEDRPKYVAIDIASGLCSDSGRNLQGALPSDLSVSFHRAKIGHYLMPMGPPAGGALWSGNVVVKDIGLQSDPGNEMVHLAAPNVELLRKRTSQHKYEHGHALILSGGPGKTGAARLAARGALRIGAGLVTIGCPMTALSEVAAQTTAIMCRPFDGAPGLTEHL
ncbi:MAG: NAD(P)H-hydrate epimerase, partial [Boseongicola sp.]